MSIAGEVFLVKLELFYGACGDGGDISIALGELVKVRIWFGVV